jgi:hypothetical protein
MRSPLSPTRSPLQNTPVRILADRNINENIKNCVKSNIKIKIDNKKNVQISDYVVMMMIIIIIIIIIIITIKKN